MTDSDQPQPVRGSRTGRPVMILFDLLGRRMALRILWELYQAAAPLTFRALQAAADTNPNVLNTRLKELTAAGFVGRGETGYGLTPRGRTLADHLLPLNALSNEWAIGLRQAVAAQNKTP